MQRVAADEGYDVRVWLICPSAGIGRWLSRRASPTPSRGFSAAGSNMARHMRRIIERVLQRLPVSRAVYGQCDRLQQEIEELRGSTAAIAGEAALWPADF